MVGPELIENKKGQKIQIKWKPNSPQSERKNHNNGSLSVCIIRGRYILKQTKSSQASHFKNSHNLDTIS